MITKITGGKLIVGEEILTGPDLYLENGSITAITRAVVSYTPSNKKPLSQDGAGRINHLNQR